MSETIKFVEVAKCLTLEDLDYTLQTLDANGISCYPDKGGTVRVNPEQYDQAKALLTI